jgi:hypothetical protein
MTKVSSPLRSLGCLALLALAANSCGASPGASSTRVPFIAFASDFASFRSWSNNTVTNTVQVSVVHVSGTRTVYINQPPAADATTFPVGTLIVKETFADGKIYARAKRGGGFNSTGALDWEWFELQETSNNDIVIQWHGFGPPSGADMYGGDANGACNDCHVAAKSNDYVLSPWLALGGNPDGIPPLDDAGIPAGAVVPDGGFTVDGGTPDAGASADGP